MASGAVERRTNGLGLAEIRFNFPNWGDEYNKNLRIIDAVITPVVGEIEGPWEILTPYEVGQRVVSTQTSIVYVCETAHTSAATGTLEDELIANPEYWRSATGTANFRGNWTTGNTYYNNDFVLQNNGYYISTDQHVSGTFATDLAAGKWILLVDLNPFISTISLTTANAVTQVDDAVIAATSEIDAAVAAGQASIDATVSAAQTSVNSTASQAITDVNAAVVGVEANLNATADAAILEVEQYVAPINQAASDALAAAVRAETARDEAEAAVGFDINDYLTIASFNTYSSNVSGTLTQLDTDIDGLTVTVTNLGNAYNAHAAATNNPHAVTKAQVGLGNVDDTADSAKPVSTAQATAIALKANLAGATFTGPILMDDSDLGTVTTGTTTFDFATKQNYQITVNGAVTFAFNNLDTDGSKEGKIQLLYTSGSITWPAALRWKKADGTITAVFADLPVKLVAAGVYDVFLSYTRGTLVARIS